MTNKQSNRQRYTDSYEYIALLKKHSLNEEGMWQIFGEDPNCDFGGTHIKPNLGFVEGKLEDVIEYAVDLPNFWSWGSGGSIKKIDNVKQVNSKTAERRRMLMERRAEYEEMLRTIDAELEKL